jgi:hypothetical protein
VLKIESDIGLKEVGQQGSNQGGQLEGLKMSILPLPIL